MAKKPEAQVTKFKFSPKIIFGAIIITAAIAFYLFTKTDTAKPSLDFNDTALKLRGFKTDSSKSSINLDQLLSGGPGKDGIPAINNPQFTPLSEADFEDNVQGIFVEFGSTRKFYPYNILVWHEIVNDTADGQNIAVTFCPLCASAIVFDRNYQGETLQFGVSGFLFESNLVMYDTKTESLWSQAKGAAIVGDYTGTKLTILPLQQITLAEVKRKYSDTLVLSKDTGYSRNYSFNPYSGYEETDEINFPVSVSDKRFKPKEIMYVVPLGEKSIAFAQIGLKDGNQKSIEVEGQTITIERLGEEINVTTNGKTLPGYFEMWFSWAVHHQENGIALEL